MLLADLLLTHSSYAVLGLAEVRHSYDECEGDVATIRSAVGLLTMIYIAAVIVIDFDVITTMIVVMVAAVIVNFVRCVMTLMLNKVEELHDQGKLYVLGRFVVNVLRFVIDSCQTETVKATLVFMNMVGVSGLQEKFIIHRKLILTIMQLSTILIEAIPTIVKTEVVTVMATIIGKGQVAMLCTIHLDRHVMMTVMCIYLIKQIQLMSANMMSMIVKAMVDHFQVETSMFHVIS
uniref:Uncharacterized protein n=1 Tax=Lygus hesperus TaxID=30085 RepID=A0A0A9YBJ4_LYGHE